MNFLNPSIFISLIFLNKFLFSALFSLFLTSNEVIIYMTLFSTNPWTKIFLPAPVFLWWYFSATILGSGIQHHNSQYLQAAY